MLKRFRLTNLLLLSAALLAGPLAAQAKLPNADAVKAAVVVQLVQFIEWPKSALPAANRPVDLCVLGGDQWVPLLREAAQGESVNGHPIKITRIGKAPEALICHILVIGAAIEQEWLDLVAKLPILTVSGEDNGPARGAMVNLTIESGRTRFKLDLERAEKARIRFSSKLLQLAGVALRGSP